MNNTVLTIDQMRETYIDEWLLIVFTALDTHLNVLAGEVIVHSKDRDEIYAALDQCKGKSYAIEHTGLETADVADLGVSSRIDGILGMDFLVANRAIVATGESEIYLPV